MGCQRAVKIALNQHWGSQGDSKGILPCESPQKRLREQEMHACGDSQGSIPFESPIPVEGEAANKGGERHDRKEGHACRGIASLR